MYSQTSNLTPEGSNINNPGLQAGEQTKNKTRLATYLCSDK